MCLAKALTAVLSIHARDGGAIPPPLNKKILGGKII